MTPAEAARVGVDAWDGACGCPICGNESCEDHLPASPDERSESVTVQTPLTAAVERERIKRAARRMVDREERGQLEIPPFVTLRERAAHARPSIEYRIDGWQPRQSRVMLAAQFKAGKTTLRDNLVRSLVDGDLFMGARVMPVAGVVAVVDVEMAEPQAEAWLISQRIANDDRVVPIFLRGMVAAFDVLDSGVRAEWARRFRDARTDYFILDCVRPVLDALGLDEQREAGRFLVALDALLKEAGIPDALIVHHMGHGAERSRGDSRLRDWPDVEWRLMRQDDDPASARFLSAFGRDVEQPESQLTYDGPTRRLTLAGGSREDAQTEATLAAIVEALNDADEPLSGRGVKDALADSEFPRAAIERALREGVRQKRLTVATGKRRARLYGVFGSVPRVSRGHLDEPVSECPAALIERDTRTLIGDGSSKW